MEKIKNYNEQEINFIKENYEKMTVKQLAESLNKSKSSIEYAVRKLGLIKQVHKPWTDNECQYLIDNYEEKTSEEIGKHLNRTIHSVNSERDRLGLVRHESWTDDEVLYLIENFLYKTHAEIGEYLKRTEEAIRAKCFDLKLYKKEVPWSDEEINFLKENYREMSNKEISSILNRSENAIHLQASRMGMKKYPYFCDYHYFDNIDTEEKAYWLGFLTADGWINKNEKSNAGVTGIELQYGDINHLKKFNKSIGGNYQITDRWIKCSLSDSDRKHHMCCIRIFSLTMYKSLVEKGFTNNKSYDFHVPLLNHDLLRHYMRGYFDGDGCFTFTNKTFHINFITASKMLNDDIIKILKLQNLNPVQQIYINDFNTTMYRLNINKNQERLDFLDWIYKDCHIYLDRKYKKYLKVKEKHNDTQSLAS